MFSLEREEGREARLFLRFRKLRRRLSANRAIGEKRGKRNSGERQGDVGRGGRKRIKPFSPGLQNPFLY